MKVEVDRKQIERAARLYNNNTDASQALGISRGGFARICRRHGIETPYMRNRRRKQRRKDTGRKQPLS